MHLFLCINKLINFPSDQYGLNFSNLIHGFMDGFIAYVSHNILALLWSMLKHACPKRILFAIEIFRLQFVPGVQLPVAREINFKL